MYYILMNVEDPIRLGIIENLLKQFPNEELIHEEIALINVILVVSP
jgi:hypothetical protein